MKRLLIFLPLIVLLSGCAGNSMAGTADADVLSIGQANNSIAYFPLFVAEQEGFFKSQGLIIGDRPRLGNGAKVQEALEASSIDIAAGVVTDAFTASRIDAYVKMIGSLVNSYYVDVTVGNKLIQETHLNKRSPLEARVKALVGKKIGITAPGSGTEALMIYLFKMFGLDAQKDATLVSVGGSDLAGIAALASGKVDAVSLGAPVGQEVEAKGIGNIFISPTRGDVPEMQGQLHGVVFTRQQTIESKPKAVQAFIRGLAEAEAYIHTQPKPRVETLLKQYLNLDQKTTSAIWDAMQPAMAQSPDIDQHRYDVANQFHVKAGLIAIALPYKDLVAEDTIQAALDQALTPTPQAHRAV